MLLKSSLYIFAALSLQACATAHIASEVKAETAGPLKKILILTTEADYDFIMLDSASYNQNIRGNFNNIENTIFRKQLEKSVQQNLGSSFTSAVKSSDIFEINTIISYADFIKKIEELEVDGILLINLVDYWNTTSTIITNTSQTSIETKTDEEPNASYNCYLLNTPGKEIIWLAQVVVNGQFAGYDVLNNRLSAKLKNRLTKDRLIADGD